MRHDFDNDPRAFDHDARAQIVRLYLTLNGYRSRHFTAGMLMLVDGRRSDSARDDRANQ